MTEAQPAPPQPPAPPRSSNDGCLIGIAIGCGGVILIFALMFAALFYFGFIERGGVYDGLRAQLNQRMVNELVPVIETYKVQHGAYPPDLETLRQAQPGGQGLFTHDGLGRPFAYERVGEDGYRLAAVGADGKPFTADDIVPEVDAATVDRLGLKNGRPVSGPEELPEPPEPPAP